MMAEAGTADKPKPRIGSSGLRARILGLVFSRSQTKFHAPPKIKKMRQPVRFRPTMSFTFTESAQAPEVSWTE
jgi:hypothetical protein